VAPKTHRVRVGFLTGRTFTVLRQLRQKATFTVLCQFQALVTFTDLPPKKPKFSTGALRAPPGKPPQHNTPPPHPRLAPLPPHLPALPPAHPSHVVFHPASRSTAASWLLRCGIPRSLGLRARGLARAWRVATFTILHTALDSAEFCTFTILRQKWPTFTVP
jgi:hypothetical protein